MIYKALTRTEALTLAKEGRGKFIGGKVFWERISPRRILVYTWDGGLQRFIRPYKAPLRKGEW